MKSKLCVICNERFETKTLSTKTCSKKCREKRKYEMNEVRRARLLGMGIKDYVEVAQKKKVCINPHCNNTFRSRHWNKKTCSPECGLIVKGIREREGREPRWMLKKGPVAKKDNSLAKWTKRGKIHYAGIRDI